MESIEKKVFRNWKKQALNKIQENDKSNIGRIDDKILDLCNYINSFDDLFTLSSCSGRISIQKLVNNKIRNVWLYISHDLVLGNEVGRIFRILNENLNIDLEFRQESVILHICARSFDIANKIMIIAKESGFNQVGIIAFKRKIVVEIISDNRIIFPINFFNDNDDLNLLIERDFLEKIISRSNQNLIEGWDKILSFKENLMKNL